MKRWNTYTLRLTSGCGLVRHVRITATWDGMEQRAAWYLANGYAEYRVVRIS